MIRGAFEDAADLSPPELRAAYEAELASTVESEGVEAVADESGVEPGRLEALLDGESPALTLDEAAGILGAAPDRPDATAIAAEARDILLIGMTNAVLDVERLASDLDGAFEPKELQQKLEGRASMTLREYALVHGFLAGATG